MAELKGIFKRGDSKNYHTSIKRFNEETGEWKWHYVSTHTVNPLKALKTREELQALEYEIAKHGDSQLTREKAFEIVNNLLQWHGIPEIKDESKSQITLKEFVEPWRDDFLKTDALATYRAVRSHTNSFRNHVGDDVILRHITQRQVQNWYNEIANEGRKASTVQGYLKSVRRMFSDALAQGIILRNPAMKIKTKDGKKRQKQPFTKQDLEIIFKEIQNLEHPEEWRIVVLFGLCLGARINDCSIRRWEELSLKGKKPYISYEPEKTRKKNITVQAPLVDPLLSALRDIGPGTGFITPQLANTRPSGKESLSIIFAQLVKDSEIDFIYEPGEGKGIDWFSKNFHSFRHTLPSLMAAANVPEQIRMGIVGHTRLETHLGYTHHDDEQMRTALQDSLASFVRE